MCELHAPEALGRNGCINVLLQGRQENGCNWKHSILYALVDLEVSSACGRLILTQCVRTLFFLGDQVDLKVREST